MSLGGFGKNRVSVIDWPPTYALGNGANVLGPITVGDGATIGTGAMVTKDVEAGATVIDTGFMSNRCWRPAGRRSLNIRYLV